MITDILTGKRIYFNQDKKQEIIHVYAYVFYIHLYFYERNI